MRKYCDPFEKEDELEQYYEEKYSGLRKVTRKETIKKPTSSYTAREANLLISIDPEVSSVSFKKLQVDLKVIISDNTCK